MDNTSTTILILTMIGIIVVYLKDIAPEVRRRQRISKALRGRKRASARKTTTYTRQTPKKQLVQVAPYKFVIN